MSVGYKNMSEILKLNRTKKTGNSQFGELYIDDVFECYTLENANTLIPTGTHKTSLRTVGGWHDKESEKEGYSDFKGMVEINVEGRKYILIHPANQWHELEGCVAVGQSIDEEKELLKSSRKAYYPLYEKIAGQDIKLEIKEKEMISAIGSIFTKGFVKDVGGVIDKLTTTEEERLKAKYQIQKLISDQEKSMQQEITKRWEADMKHGSWLSKNVRPGTLVYLVMIYTILAFTDGNIMDFTIKENYSEGFIQLLQLFGVAYVGSRGLEKYKGVAK